MSRWDADRQEWVPDPGEDGRTGAAGTRRLLLVILVAVVLCGGIGAGIWALVRDDGGPDDDRVLPGPDVTYSSTFDPGGETPTDDPAPTPGPTDTGTDTDTGTGGEAPAGYERVEDPAGFRIDVPEGWVRSEETDGVFYRSPDQRSLLQIFSLRGPETTPYESLTATEKQVSQNPGYRFYHLERLDWQDAAELQYAYDHAQFGPRRVIDVAFTAPDDVQYAVLVAGPQENWPLQAEQEQAAIDAFCPTAYCS
ncbi:hypothetical protein ACFQVC_06040 [Streptomyces monticola]|uniref:Serine/arginine repetitive matrix protein 2 n=1 Tax=Streptomyces monticola TaxID=2666263 RepID=A0ABW2JCP3_9ACTN